MSYRRDLLAAKPGQFKLLRYGRQTSVEVYVECWPLIHTITPFIYVPAVNETSMQPRLIENDDVLHEVFRFLDPSATEPTRCIGAQEHENRCRTALARSARASKVISEHALNVLWRRSEGLLDIFSILPPFKRGPPSAVEPSDGDDVDVHDGPPKVKGLWVRPVWAVMTHQTDFKPHRGSLMLSRRRTGGDTKHTRSASEFSPWLGRRGKSIRPSSPRSPA